MSNTETFQEKKRVLILGNSPLPFENLRKTFAPGIRTWYFARSALDANCDVSIIGYRIPNVYDKEFPDEKFTKKEGIDYLSVKGEIFENKGWLTKKIKDFKPDCIVGINTHPSSVVADLNLDIPFWADLNGSVMAEAQAKAHVYNDDKFIHHFFKMESKVLNKADVFSAVSEAQGFSLVGELGIWGRLNKDTMGYRFVRVIPNAAEDKKFKHTKNVIRGILAKETDFVVLYSGGYNTWTDIETLFYGLEKAMEKNPNLVFVSTGGQIEGHDNLTYQQFQDMIESSKFADRFHLLGWVPSEDVSNFYLEADLGINSDKYCYEAILGARTRILDWLQASLTFISSPLSEISNYLIKNNLAYGFEVGNSDNLAENLIKISSNRNDLDDKKTRMKKILEEEFTPKFTLREFREWVKNPNHSPDYGKIENLIPSNYDFQNTDSNSIENLAVSTWPKIFSLLRFLHLSKYDEKVKKFGINLVSTKKTSKYRARFLKVSIPEMVQGKKYLIPVSVKNVGDADWKNDKESINAVNLSYVWKDDSGKIVLKNEERTSLPESVKVGGKIESNLKLITPQKAGKFVLQIDLVKEGEFWFSEIGSQPYRATVVVKIRNNS